MFSDFAQIYNINVAVALAIATLTVGINLIVDDISAHSGGKLSKRL